MTELSGRAVPDHPGADGRAVPHARRQSAQRARTCSRSACWRASTAATWTASRSRSPTPSARRARRCTQQNVALLELGYAWAEEHIDFRVEIPAPITEALVVMNGNEALGLGAIASGMELCAMYPITPATSVSHYLSEVFERFGGIVHQAEDEIAAVGRRHRRVVRRQGGLHHHVGPGTRAQDGVPRSRRHDRDAAGAGGRAARRPEHRAADQGGAVRPAGRAVRQTGRRAARRHGAGDHRGVLPHHGDGAADRRDVPHRGDGALRRQPGDRRDAVSRARSPTRAGRRSRSTSRRCAKGRRRTSGIRAPVSRRASFPAAGRDVHAHRACRTTKGARWRTAPACISTRRRCAAASWRCCRAA